MLYRHLSIWLYILYIYIFKHAYQEKGMCRTQCVGEKRLSQKAERCIGTAWGWQLQFPCLSVHLSIFSYLIYIYIYTHIIYIIIYMCHILWVSSFSTCASPQLGSVPGQTGPQPLPMPWMPQWDKLSTVPWFLLDVPFGHLTVINGGY